MIKNLHFNRSLTRILGTLTFAIFMLTPGLSWAQPWTYDLGTGTGSHTSGTSASFLPTPPSGSTYVRIGTAGGSINLENPGLASLGTNTELRGVAPTTASVNKVSVYDYAAGKTGYLKFSVLLGNSSGGSTVTSGTWSLWIGDGAMFNNTSAFTSAQTFTGIRWVYGTSGTITTNFRSGGNWIALGSTPFAQGNLYAVEIYFNNTTTTQNYVRGTAQTVAANKQDIWVNGTLIGDDIAKGELGNNVNIDSWMFYGETSTSNAANIFLDDFEYSNVLPTGGITVPATQATNITFGSIGQNGMTTSWTNGDGAKRVVKMNTTNSFTAPADGTDPTANAVYSGSGEQVVYNGSSNTVAVTGLSASTTYWYRVYEYNGSGATTKYNISTATNNPNSQATTAPTPTITLTPTTLNGFNYVAGFGPSVEQTFTVLGTSLTNDVSIAASANYEISKTSGSGYTTPLTFTPAQVATAQTIYVRLKSGLSAGNYNSEVITASSTGASSTTLTCNGSVSAFSNLSDITENTSYAYKTNIDYKTFQAPTITNTAHSEGVFQFIIRDGGSTANDVDAAATELNAITFNVINSAFIRSAALFSGNTMVYNNPVIDAGTIAFSGMSGDDVKALDNSTINLTLRVSFKTTVTDNQQMQFTIANATASAAGSGFAAANAGGAQSSISGDRNRIEVSASQLAFTQQPTTTSAGVAMTPAVTVTVKDVNNNTDLDYSGVISITSTGTLTGSPVPATAASGVATFSSLTHTVIGTGLMLTAAASGLISAESNAFDITSIVYVNGDFRTTGSGTWANNNSTPAIWEKFDGANWANSNSPAYNTANNVYIGHTITTGSSFGSSIKLKIMNGGTFNCNHASTSATIYIYNGGILNINASLSIGSGGSFGIEDNGSVYINVAYGTPASSIWTGTEIFHPNSNLIIKNWDFANDLLVPDNTAISTNTFNGYTACFGNVKIDAGTNTTAWSMLASGTTVNLAHGNLEFISNAANINIATTGTVTTGIGGNFYVDDLYSGTNVIAFKTSGTMNFTVKGNFLQDAATVRVHSGSTSGASTVLNVDGNMILTPSAALDYNSTVSANTSATINLKGDLTGTGSGLLQNSNTSNFGAFNFIGTGDGLSDATTQTIDIANTSSNENRNINFNVKSGAYVKLINRNFELGTNSKMTVEGGGVLDFGFNGTTPLNIDKSGTQTGASFEVMSGGILKISSTDGIDASSTSIGNVRTPGSRAFSTTANYIYYGTSVQTTGSGLPVTVNNLTINNTSGLSLSQNVNSTGTLDFINGILTTGSNVITAAGTITGFDASKYVNGKLALVYSAAGSKTFPIGKGGNYRPLSLNYTALTGTSTVTAEQIEGQAVPGDAPANTTLWAGRYWTINESGSSLRTYDVTLNGSGFSPTNSAKIIKGNGGNTNAIYAATFSSPNYTATGFTSFSNFGFGEYSVPTTTTPAEAVVCEGTTSVDLKATVSPAPNGGTVEFFINGSSVGSVAVNTGTGVATLNYNPSALTANAFIRADFSGFGDYLASTSNPGNNKTLTVNPLPAAAATISGTPSVTQGSTGISYSVGAIANATSYVWAYSGDGVTINGTGASVTLDFSASANGGNLTVSGLNDCGNGVVSPAFAITVGPGSAPDYTIFSGTGNWTTSANWDPGIPGPNSEAIINGTATITTAVEVTTLTINSQLIIGSGGSLTVSGILTNSAGNSGLIIESGGSLIENNGVSATVKRDITNSTWHLISVPNNNTKASTFMHDYLQTWDEGSSDWTDIEDPETALNPGIGYGLWSVSGTTESIFAGALNTGDHDYNVTVSATSGLNIGANLLGNPYPCFIDWNGLQSELGSVYYWDGSAYVAYSAVGELGVGSRFVPPMQGFFVIAPSAKTFTLTNGNKAHSTPNYYKSASELADNTLVLATMGESYSDKLFINFNPASTADFDYQYDAYKLLAFTPGQSELYSFNGNKKLSIDVRPEREVIQLGFRNDQSGTYQIGISDFADINVAYIEDTKTKTYHDLFTGPYSFDYTAGESEQRLLLHFGTTSVPENGSVVNTNIYSYQETVYVNLADNTEGNIYIYNLAGQLVTAKESASGNVRIGLTSTGVYMVKVVTQKETLTQKVMIR